jgi:hypothetical protein
MYNYYRGYELVLIMQPESLDYAEFMTIRFHQIFNVVINPLALNYVIWSNFL